LNLTRLRIMENNLHITLTPFRNETRVLKETASLVRSGLVQNVHIAALYEAGLKEHEKIDSRRSVWRINFKTRKLSRSLVMQLTKYIEFCMKVILYARRHNIKLVNIHSIALLPLGVILKWACNAKLVYDTHELETETYGLAGLRKDIAKIAERVLIKYVDLVLVVGECINEWYRKKYRLSNIVTVLNCPEFASPDRSRVLHHELGIPERRKIIIYLGGLLRGRGIEKLLTVFSEHDDEKHVLVLMGYGELETTIKEYARSYRNIFYHDAVPPTEVIEYAACADLGICYIDNDSLNDRWCLPNKLFEYISAGLPVIVNNAPEMRQVVNENRIGIVLDNLTTESLINGLDEIARMHSTTLSNNLRRTAEKFCWEKQAGLMITAYRKHILGEDADI
jgi:glycosyltransferase involved in cell wall biosynthesis